MWWSIGRTVEIWKGVSGVSIVVDDDGCVCVGVGKVRRKKG